MNITLAPADPEYGKDIISNLWQYYLYDMSEFMGWGPSDHGLYEDDPYYFIDEYWEDDKHHAYLIMCDGELAGFSLLRPYADEPERFDVGQFYILRKFKGHGVGREAFFKSLSCYKGKWLTRVLEKNTNAMEFWKRVIGESSNNNFELTLETYGKNDMYFFRYDTSTG